MISERISDDIAPQIKILNLVIPILMQYLRPFVNKLFVLSISEWPFYTGSTEDETSTHHKTKIASKNNESRSHQPGGRGQSIINWSFHLRFPLFYIAYLELI